MASTIDEITKLNRQPDIGVLAGYNAGQILDALRTLRINGLISPALTNYVEENCERFIRTVHLLPSGISTVLEISAKPYFTTVLANWFRPDLQITLTNFFEPQPSRPEDIVQASRPDRSSFYNIYEFVNVDVESEPLPFADGSFDCVLFCDVLEYLRNDPHSAMTEISRVLKPGGQLILTTPNAARLENVAKMMSGVNTFAPYSGMGASGRRNREYTRHELHSLLSHFGFSVDTMYTADVRDNRALDYNPSLSAILPSLSHRIEDLGQHHFTRSKLEGKPNTKKQSWLYADYSENEIDFTPL